MSKAKEEGLDIPEIEAVTPVSIGRVAAEQGASERVTKIEAIHSRAADVV